MRTLTSALQSAPSGALIVHFCLFAHGSIFSVVSGYRHELLVAITHVSEDDGLVVEQLGAVGAGSGRSGKRHGEQHGAVTGAVGGRMLLRQHGAWFTRLLFDPVST